MSEKSYKIRFDAENCIGAGRCAEEAPDHWTLNFETGVAEPARPLVSEDELEANLRAARACPARNGRGVIHIHDRRTGERIGPRVAENDGGDASS